MNHKRVLKLYTFAFMFTICIFGNAQAETVTVKCVTNAEETNISVIGNGHENAPWRARVRSGTSQPVYSKLPLKHTIKGEVEYDFSSNPFDIKRGETPISRTFVKNNHVIGELFLVSTTGRLIFAGSVSATCTSK